MQNLNKVTKIKLLVPLTYFVISVIFIVLTWPIVLQTHHVIGAILTIVAFTFWVMARVQLGSAFTIAPKSKFIVRSGLYSKLRHPVYYFSILAVAGLGIYIWQWPMILIIALLVTLEMYRIRKEEHLLTSQFGKDYLDYKKGTWF